MNEYTTNQPIGSTVSDHDITHRLHNGRCLDCPNSSMKELRIMFNYQPRNGRTLADCQDVYGWLLTKDEEIAQAFRDKWEPVVKKLKKDYQKMLKRK